MAKIYSPAHSERASGKLAKNIVFLNRDFTAAVQIRTKKKDRKSIAQLEQRKYFKIANTKWKLLTHDDKLAWLARSYNVRAADWIYQNIYGLKKDYTQIEKKQTGRNVFLKQVLKTLRNKKEWNTIYNIKLTKLNGQINIKYNIEYAEKTRIQIGHGLINGSWHTRYEGWGPWTIWHVGDDVIATEKEITVPYHGGPIWWVYQILCVEDPYYSESGWYIIKPA